MKLIMLGDVHRNTRHFQHLIITAADLGVQKIVQVGDFGYFAEEFDTVKYVDALQSTADKCNVHIYAIAGNHDSGFCWRTLTDSTMAKNKGFTYLRKNILFAPYVHEWEWDSKRFASVGGAVSIDKQWRLETERENRRPRTLWWPNEIASDEELSEVRNEKVDYLVTHDASNYSPFEFGLKVDVDSEANRRRIDAVLNKTRPELHFHGHYHTKIEWFNWKSSGYEHETQTYGLGMDGMINSWGVLNTDDNTFTWESEL